MARSRWSRVLVAQINVEDTPEGPRVVDLVLTPIRGSGGFEAQLDEPVDPDIREQHRPAVEDFDFYNS